MKHFIFILLFITLNFSQNNDYYLKNKIERKVHPLAWESYDINETLELLYGKDRVYEMSRDIHIKLPTNTNEQMNTSGYGNFSLSSNKKVKSIAILQKKEGDRALVTLYYPYSDSVNILLPLKILKPYLTMMIEGMKVVVITETEDNHLFINEYTIKYSYMCSWGDGMSNYIEGLRGDLNKNTLKTKYKINEKGIGYLKFMIHHPMVSYIEAEKLKSKVNFVSHIKGRIQEKKLFDLYTSEYIGKDFLMKMEFKNMKLGENISFSYTTINGEVTSKKVKPRKAKKIFIKKGKI